MPRPAWAEMLLRLVEEVTWDRAAIARPVEVVTGITLPPAVVVAIVPALTACIGKISLFF